MSNNIVKATPGPFFVTIFLYIVIMAFIGYYSSKKTTNLGEFFTMGGSAGSIVSGLAYFATQYSMSTFMGVPATTYQVGYPGLGVSVPGLAFSMIIPAVLVGKNLMVMGKKYKYYTMADYLADRYESEFLRLLLAVMMIIFLIPNMGAQVIGAGVIVNVFTGLPNWVGIVGMGIIVIFYCMAGGIRGAMITDVIQGLLMVSTAIVTFALTIKMGGGIQNINEAIAKNAPEMMIFPGKNNYMPWQNYMSQIALWSFFTIGQPQLFTKFFAMKNHKTMFRSVLLGTIGMLLAATLIEWSGVNASVFIKGLEGAEADMVVPIILQRGLNPFVASLLVAGITAAGMSTIDSLLIMSTGAITRDIYQMRINKNATDEQVMQMSKIVTVIIGIIVIIFGVFRPASIFQIVLFAFGGMGAFTVPVILGMYWKKATKQGAISSVIVTVIVMILLTFNYKSLAFGFHPLLPASLVGTVVMVVVSLMTESVSEETLERHFNYIKDYRI